MNFKLWLEADRQLTFDFMKTPKVNRRQIGGMKLFGPVYHGTTPENQENIDDIGFKIFTGGARTGNVRHGFELGNYGVGGIPPVHFLGFGVYFTTNKSIAKSFNLDTTRGLKTYYLHVPRLETINFGSTNTMMKWWKKHGYNLDKSDEEMRVQATIALTNNLKSQFDAVWYKGKGIARLLDGDQICVYDVNNIYEYDKSTDEGIELEKGIWGNIGDRFIFANTKATAVINEMNAVGNNYLYDPFYQMLGQSNYSLYIKSYKDSANEVYKYYAPLMKRAIVGKPDFEELFKRVMSNRNIVDREQAIDYYIKEKLTFNSFSRTPSKLIGKILKKGERK